MNVSNCRGQTDPAPGDCANQEWRIQPWWSMPWSCVLRHPDDKVRSLISDYARHGANNEHCGYSQSNRLSFWNCLEAVGYDPANITTDCDADCSSSTAAIVKAVGYTLGISALEQVNEGLTTFYMRNDFAAAGFEILGGAYCASDAALVPGDVLLNDSCHVCIAVADYDLNGVTGCDTQQSEQTAEPSAEPVNRKRVYMTTQVPLLRQDWIGTDPLPEVRACQSLLALHGAEIDVDGVYGDNTVNAVTLFQSTNRLDADGQCGAQTWKKLIEGE